MSQLDPGATVRCRGVCGPSMGKSWHHGVQCLTQRGSVLLHMENTLLQLQVIPTEMLILLKNPATYIITNLL